MSLLLVLGIYWADVSVSRIITDKLGYTSGKIVQFSSNVKIIDKSIARELKRYISK